MFTDTVQTDKTDKASPVAAGDNSLSGQVFASMVADQAQSKALKNADQAISNPTEHQQFKQDVQDFEKRAAKAGLSPTEITGTYEQINRLFSGTGKDPLTTGQRTQLAEQIMHFAAKPIEISQGSYSTCNVTAVEARIFSQNPSQAAKLISDVALDGAYKSSAGITVDYSNSLADSRQPHGQAKTNPPQDGERSYASQLFQVTAVNLYYQQLAKSDETGYFQYEQHDNDYLVPGTKPAYKSASGEALIGYRKDGKFVQMVTDDPYFYPDQMTGVMNQITGKNEKGVVLVQKAENTEAKLAGVVATPAALDATLTRMKAAGQLPAIIEIADSDVLFSRNGSAGAHVVSITDYDSKTKTVAVDNEWSSKDDYLDGRSLRMTDVFKAMVNPGDSSADLKSRVTRDLRDRASERAGGVIDAAVEWDYARDKVMASTTTPDGSKILTDDENALARTGPVWQKQLADGTLDSREARVAVKDMAMTIAWMDGPQIETLMKQPYWTTALTLMKRFPDEINNSSLDDSRKKLIFQ